MLYFTTDDKRLRTENHKLITGLRGLLFRSANVSQKFNGECGSQPSLDPAGERPEVGDPLQFVIGELNIEMMLKPGEQVERLQAVDPERLEEIVVRSELLARYFELGRREVEYLVQSFFAVCHCLILILIERCQGK